MEPETQYLRNQPPNKFLCFMKSCAEFCKSQIVRASQSSQNYHFYGEKIEFEARYSHCYKMHFFGPDLVLAIFSFLALAFKLLGIRSCF